MGKREKWLKNLTAGLLRSIFLSRAVRRMPTETVERDSLLVGILNNRLFILDKSKPVARRGRKAMGPRGKDEG
jgi:hypothetical protein